MGKWGLINKVISSQFKISVGIIALFTILTESSIHVKLAERRLVKVLLWCKWIFLAIMPMSRSTIRSMMIILHRLWRRLISFIMHLGTITTRNLNKIWFTYSTTVRLSWLIFLHPVFGYILHFWWPIILTVVISVRWFLLAVSLVVVTSLIMWTLLFYKYLLILSHVKLVSGNRLKIKKS